jgi:hypothetical protein
MRLAQLGPPGLERPVVLDRAGRAYDLSALTPEIGGRRTAGDVVELEIDGLGRQRHVLGAA